MGMPPPPGTVPVEYNQTKRPAGSPPPPPGTVDAGVYNEAPKSQENTSEYQFKGSKLYQPLINKYCLRFNLDPNVISRLFETESSFNPKAHNSIGASGLGQIMPETARELGIRDVFDPEQNIEGATRLFSQNLKRHGGDYVAAVASYNGGDGAVDHARKNGTYANWGSKENPNETKNYIQKILGRGMDYGQKYQVSGTKKENVPNLNPKGFNTLAAKPPVQKTNPFQDILANMNKPIAGTADAAEKPSPPPPPGTVAAPSYYVTPEKREINSENELLKKGGDFFKAVSKPFDLLNPISRYQELRKALSSGAKTNPRLAYFDKFIKKNIDMPTYKLFNEGAFGNAIKNFDPVMQVYFEIFNAIELDTQKYGLAGAIGTKADKDPNSAQSRLTKHLMALDFEGAKENYADSPNMNKLLAKGGDQFAAARLKHPIGDAIYTGGKQLFNPGYIITGEIAGRALKGIGAGIDAAAKASPKIASIVDGPLNADVNSALRRSKGTTGVNAVQSLTRDAGYVKEHNRAYVYNIYKGLQKEQVTETHRLSERFGAAIKSGMSPVEAKKYVLENFRNKNRRDLVDGKFKVVLDPKNGPSLMDRGIADRHAYDNLDEESLKTGALDPKKQFGKDGSGVYSNRKGAYNKTVEETPEVEAIRASRIKSKTGMTDGHKKYEFYDDIPKEGGEYSLAEDYHAGEQLLKHMNARAVPNSEYYAGKKMYSTGVFEGDVEFRSSTPKEERDKINKQRSDDQLLAEWASDEKDTAYALKKSQNDAKNLPTPKPYRSNGKIALPQLSESFGYGKLGEDLKKTESMREAKAFKHNDSIEKINAQRVEDGNSPWTPKEFEEKSRSVGDTRLEFKDVRGEDGRMVQTRHWTGKLAQQEQDLIKLKSEATAYRSRIEGAVLETRSSALSLYEKEINRTQDQMQIISDRIQKISADVTESNKKTSAIILAEQSKAMEKMYGRLEKLKSKQSASLERQTSATMKVAQKGLSGVGSASNDATAQKSIDKLGEKLSGISRKNDQRLGNSIKEAEIIGKPAQKLLSAQDTKIAQLDKLALKKSGDFMTAQDDYHYIQQYKSLREDGLGAKAKEIEEKHDKETVRYMESKGLGRVSQVIPEGLGKGLLRSSEFAVAKAPVLDSIAASYDYQLKMSKMTGLQKNVTSIVNFVRQGQLINVSVHILGNVPFNAFAQAKANGVAASFVAKVGKGLVHEGEIAFRKSAAASLNKLGIVVSKEMPERLKIAIELANQRSMEHAEMGIHAPAMGGSGRTLFGGDTDHLLLKSWKDVPKFSVEAADKLIAQQWAWNGAVTFGGEKFISDALGSALRETGQFTDEEVGRIVRSGLGDYENVKPGSWISKLIFFWPFTKGNDLLWLKLGLTHPEIGAASEKAVEEYNSDRGYKTDPRKKYSILYGDKRNPKPFVPIFFPDRKIGEFKNVYDGFTGDNIVDGFAAIEKLATGTLQPGPLLGVSTISTIAAPPIDPNTPGGFRTIFNKNEAVPNSEKAKQFANFNARTWIGGYAAVQDYLKSFGLIENNESDIETHGQIREKINQMTLAIFFFGSPISSFSQKMQDKIAIKQMTRTGEKWSKINRLAKQNGQPPVFTEKDRNIRNAAYTLHRHNIYYGNSEASDQPLPAPAGVEPTTVPAVGGSVEPQPPPTSAPSGNAPSGNAPSGNAPPPGTVDAGTYAPPPGTVEIPNAK